MMQLNTIYKEYDKHAQRMYPKNAAHPRNSYHDADTSMFTYIFYLYRITKVVPPQER
jgi:hypothetical protein